MVGDINMTYVLFLGLFAIILRKRTMSSSIVNIDVLLKVTQNPPHTPLKTKSLSRINPERLDIIGGA